MNVKPFEIDPVCNFQYVIVLQVLLLKMLKLQVYFPWDMTGERGQMMMMMEQMQ